MLLAFLDILSIIKIYFQRLIWLHVHTKVFTVSNFLSFQGVAFQCMGMLDCGVSSWDPQYGKTPCPTWFAIQSKCRDLAAGWHSLNDYWSVCKLYSHRQRDESESWSCLEGHLSTAIRVRDQELNFEGSRSPLVCCSKHTPNNHTLYSIVQEGWNPKMFLVCHSYVVSWGVDPGKPSRRL